MWQGNYQFLGEYKMRTEQEFTANLVGTYHLESGDVVTDQKGEQGEVVGHDSDGNPVVMFDSGERTVDINKETLIKKNASSRPGTYTRPKHELRIPLRTACRIGFVKLYSNIYEYHVDYGFKTAETYPWDHGSLWKTSTDEQGNQFLTKESIIEDEAVIKPGDPDSEYQKSQLEDPSGDPGIGNSKDDFHILH